MLEHARILAQQLRIKSSMIYSGEKIKWGSECVLMDAASETILALASEVQRLSVGNEKKWSDRYQKVLDDNNDLKVEIQKLKMSTVKDSLTDEYGAVGDGVTDDTAAIQNQYNKQHKSHD